MSCASCIQLGLACPCMPTFSIQLGSRYVRKALAPTVSTEAASGSLLPSSLRLLWVALSGAVVLQAHTHHSSIGHARLETTARPSANQSTTSLQSVARSSPLHAYSFCGRRIEPAEDVGIRCGEKTHSGSFASLKNRRSELFGSNSRRRVPILTLTGRASRSASHPIFTKQHIIARCALRVLYILQQNVSYSYVEKHIL